MIDLTFLPNERRNLFHKRLISAATGFVTSGFNPLAAASSFIAPVKRPARNVIPRSLTARTSTAGEAGKGLGRRIKFGGGSSLIRGIAGPASAAALGFQVGGDCFIPGQRVDPVTGKCKFFFGEQTGPDDVPLQTGTGLPGGDVVMGRYGAAEVPGQKIVNRAVCRPGMVVGDDGLCYNRTQIRNNQRQWPRGRRPLLTGGDMRAISVAARAGARLERTTKRLQKIGLMKKPARPVKRITSGSTEHHHHS